MAEKVSKGISSAARPCNSTRSTAGEVRVVHISNPTIMVETTASEFRGVVQSLTGQKRSSPSGSEDEEINLYSDNQYGSQVKAPTLLEDELWGFNDMKSSESATIGDIATVNGCCNDNDRDDGDIRISEELEVQAIQNPGYVASQYQVFEIETVEGIGDTRRIVFDTCAPSIFFL